MTVNILGVAVKITLPMLVVACALPAFGTPVDFTTTGTFTCGVHSIGCSTSNGGESLTITNDGNTLKITAVGFTNDNVFPGDTNPDINGSPLDDVNVMTFDITSTNRPNVGGNGVNTTGVTFTLNIDQTSPAGSPNSGDLGGTFSGFINAKGSNTTINFANNQTSLLLAGNITYTLDFLNPGVNTWTIPNPGINKTGITTETATVTPEPTFMMVTGLGFAGCAFVAYRRKRTI